MNSPAFLAVLITALGFGLWPLVARFAALSPIATALFASVGTVIVVAAGMRLPMFTYGQISGGAALICLVGGILNGIGFLAYAYIISNSDWNLSLYIPIAVVAMSVMTVIGGIILFHEPVTAQKLAGILLAIAAIWVLST